MLLISENKKMQVKKISVDLKEESASNQQKWKSYKINWSR